MKGWPGFRISYPLTASARERLALQVMAVYNRKEEEK